MNRLVPSLFLVMSLLIAGCQAVPSPSEATPTVRVYSGTFVWDSDREAGPDGVQCLATVFDREEVLDNGLMRWRGITIYVTGPEKDVTLVEAEMIVDPKTRRFELREHNATRSDFVGNGWFEGELLADGLLLEGRWQEDQETDVRSQSQTQSQAQVATRPQTNGSGRLSMVRGPNARCALARDA